MRRLMARAGIAGLAGGVAMIPVGVLLRRVLGYSLNVYGELLLRTLLGRTPVWALAVEHFLISWGMALPLVAFLGPLRRASPFAVGAAYGAVIWLVVNSLALPLAFGRPTPWQLGWPAIWPSLAVHLAYGVAASAAAVQVDRWRAAAGPGA